MRKRVLNIVLVLAVLAAPGVVAGQEAASDILQTSVAFNGDGATLELELASGRTLKLRLDDGIAYIGGTEVGRYTEGGTLESSWRELLNGLADGQTASAWSEFSEAEFGADEPVADAIAQALRPHFAGATDQAAAGPAAADVADEAATARTAQEIAEQVGTTVGQAVREAVVGGLVVELSNADNLGRSLERIGLSRELVDVLNGDMDRRVRVVLDADEYRLPEGAALDEMLVLVETDGVIAGTVDANVLVADGSLLITSSGRIEGDVIGIDASVHNQGTIAGELRWLEQPTPVFVGPRSPRVSLDRPGPSIFSSLGRGLSALLQTIAMYALFAFLGAVAVYFFRGHLETVSDTVSYSFGRSFLAGLAGQVLFLPILVVMVALVITAIGAPFYVIGAILLALFGYLGVAHSAGENLTRYRFPSWAARVRRSNSYYYVLNGLGVLLALFVGAAVTQVFSPILGWAHDLLIVSAWILTWVAATAGLGAALLSRAGTRRTYARPREVPADSFRGADRERRAS
ncbi:MAG: hypothetical protein GWN99_12710 [Gemmatimonadetes bacterium]|uniref:Uncharacterized protein n=1 Tax=Candidatus Kutchimonas denitrificans TaxID=3056748 RepID=A0AAE4Z8G0_9BACT|nr:hypothetical protein [Gemmatimonadota bacterium]NIR75593.1 hypothetical protein [Candidatus Kutchimonas denitrificans]NIS01907.1 hypothetical protein [Gemmatimonadota bacterium]NIT67688.1 hypothetical protein [Gemmatimonadota bacterium]NIU53562.1 hypothetical protein [Gemmatimonadota bacterium]